MSKHEYCTVIIGSGISGLYCALKTQQLTNKKVLIITKSTIELSNSYYAQGGMVAVLKSNKNDSVELHVSDTLKAGAGLNDEQTVEFISQNSDEVVKDLLKFGVNFDKQNDEFALTKEAAHSVRRILHAQGDATGRQMETDLINAVKFNDNISILENTTATKLIVSEGICFGVEVLTNGEKYIINSKSVVIATGGIGQIYKYTTNPICATGDGLALCYDAGACLRDMEFVQFHPTALAISDNENNNRFLISEAVRGEGAKLCDKNGCYYMDKYDQRKELAPRDIVARANFTEMIENNESCVYLDATVIEKEKLLNRFPTIAKKCAQYGIDITKDNIPVSPAAHYFMGGVKTDLNFETSIKNLYAIGEVASTGLHGANRLASNSLLECVVCAYKIAKVLASKNLKTFSVDIDNSKSVQQEQDKNILDKKEKLQEIMWENVGIFRNKKGLEFALQEIDNIEIPQNPTTKQEYELKNMLTVAKLITQCALNRKESRGAHYRTDYLQTNKVAQHSEIFKENNNVK